MGDWKTRLLLFVLLMTSFSAIVYEVVWGRYLSFIFGTSAFAITTVLTVFMAGLALGSLYGGRIIDSIERKYQFLGYVEILIGISCLATLYFIPAIKYPYLWLYELFGGNLFLFHVSLFMLSAVILLIPTFLIGVAFPAVVKLYFNERKRIGSSVGTAYMFDTVGGSAGALLTGFFFVVMFGFYRTSLMASVLNIIVGLVILVAFWRRSFRQVHTDAARKVVRDRILLVIFFFSGFAALMFEVIWSRYIGLIYGSSIHSFAIVLASFLAGLGLGGFIVSRYIDRIREKILLFAFIELLIGLIGMSLVVIFPALEGWFLEIFFMISSYTVFNSLLFIVCFVLLLIPTMLMGATLPVISAVYASETRVGSDVGRLFSVNSFGSIFGSFLAGFVVIPLLGLAYSSLIAGLIYIAIALVFLYFYTDHVEKVLLKDCLILVCVLLLLGFVFILSFFDPGHLYKGVYYHGTRYDNSSVIFETNIETTTELLYKANSPYGTVTVFRAWDGSDVWLKNNGKTDASLGDMVTQGMLAHIPLALHDNPRQVLNIGMGGAFSAASVLAYPDVDGLDIVEIDPEVVEACRTVLGPYNNYALQDLRAKTVVADGRNYLFSTEKSYDVIISEPPNIWISGVSNLFTLEFYSLVAERLDKGGVFSQWFPYYDMLDYDYLIAINTMGQVFPYLYEFDLGGDIVVIASEEPIDIYEDINRFRISQDFVDYDFSMMISESDLAWDLLYDEYGDYKEYDPYERNYDFLTSYYTRGPEELKDETEHVSLVNTDDWPILEFAGLRNKYKKFR